MRGAVALVLVAPQESDAAGGEKPAVEHVVVVRPNLRLPRALTAFAAGGVLAIAGVLMQVLLRNPLADPFIMGVSGGAAVAALSAMLLGASGLLITAGSGSRSSRAARS